MTKGKAKNYKKGKVGERIARRYLERKGWKWVESNYKNQRGEIDLIMEDNDTLVFVEAKLKLGERYGRPEEMISRAKIGQIRRVAEAYVVLEKPSWQKFRIDAVCIVIKDKRIKRISHYENLES